MRLHRGMTVHYVMANRRWNNKRPLRIDLGTRGGSNSKLKMIAGETSKSKLNSSNHQCSHRSLVSLPVNGPPLTLRSRLFVFAYSYQKLEVRIFLSKLLRKRKKILLSSVCSWNVHSWKINFRFARRSPESRPVVPSHCTLPWYPQRQSFPETRL